MRKARILFSQKVNLQDIQVIHNKSNRSIDPWLDSIIEKEWKAKYAQAKKDGKLIWDSDLYRLNGYYLKDGKLVLDLGTMRFGISQTMKQTDYIDNYSEAYYPKTIYIAATIETQDHKFVFGKLSGKTAVTGDYDILGGGLNKSEGVINNGNDILNVLLRELDEEMNIAKYNVETMSFLGLILSNTGSVAIAVQIKLNIDSKTLQSQFIDRSAKDEFVELKFVGKREFKSFMMKLGKIKPSMVELLEKTS